MNLQVTIGATNDNDGVLVVFCGVEVFMCFHGVYVGCGWDRHLCYIGQNHVKDWGSTPPQVINVFKFV